VDEIERLNELVRGSIDSDNRAYQEIQRLSLRLSESKKSAESARMEAQEKAERIGSLESELNTMLHTHDVLRQLTRDLESKLVTALASEQHLRAVGDERQEKTAQLQKRCDEQQRQVRQLQTEIQENAALYRK